nr:tetratricopeptide repeat protein 4 isoform X2 [Parasteatoda tepidariorum]
MQLEAFFPVKSINNKKRTFSCLYFKIDDSLKMASNMNREEILKEAKNMDADELVDKLNQDTADFLAQLPKGKKEDLWSFNDWDTEMQKHPLFMTKPPAEGEEMSPLIEAIQSLKYDPDENTPEELALSYKEDGNVNFKGKKYRWAVDSYTEGLKANCSDEELNAQLYSNRAAAHYHIGALCCFKLNKMVECISWCHEGLTVNPDNKLLEELKNKALQKKKADDRDRRKALAQDSKRQKELEVVKKVIAERKIQLGSNNLDFENVQTICPSAVSARVHLDQDNKLVWPVMILYPEYGTSDYIQEFHEESVFLDHFEVMFQDPPGWDQDGKYSLENLQISFMDNAPSVEIITVKITDTLKNVLSHKRYKVYDGTPAFFVTAADSSFDREFRKTYRVGN